jgi:predicted phage tail protein
MRTIHLHGKLKKSFGGPLEMDVRSTADAVRALCANFPEATQVLAKGEYRIVCGSKARGVGIGIDTLDLYLPTGKSLHIIPARGGNKNGGAVKAVAGMAMLAVALIAAPVGAAGAGLFGGSQFFTSLGIMGVGLTLTGISQMLTPAPKMPKMESFEREETPSFLLGGAVNATGQGLPVPIVFGTMRTGGVVISGGVTVEDFK